MKETCIHSTEGVCRKCRLINSFEEVKPKVKLHFSGPSPPEIFVGRMGYPHIRAGILAPPTFESKHDEFSTAKEWSKHNLSIANVLRLRGQMIYGRTMTHIKEPHRIKQTIHELALTHKKVSSEFFLKKQPHTKDYSVSSVLKPMTNPAPIKKVIIEDNTNVHKKVDYIVNDTDAKAVDAVIELNKKIDVAHLQKLLAAGLLGEEKARKMVPTRWSITAIDDIVSKNLIEHIKTYDEIQSITLLEGSYLGNYISILILPEQFSFEAIEVWEDDDNIHMENNPVIAQDYEGYYGRKTYAKNIIGGYYAMRIGACEYLKRIKKQGTVFVFREITNEYYAPLGVGIVREATRRAIQNKPKSFESVNQAVNYIKQHQKMKHEYLHESWVLKNYKKQKKIKDFF